jgi:hypothetical protein
LIGFGLWSCGGAQPGGAQAVAPDAVGAASRGELAEVPPEVGKGMWLRVASPVRDLPILAQLLPVEENVLVLLGNPERSLMILAGDKVAAAVDLSQPLDAMAGVGPADEGKFALAFAARPDAREQLSLRRVARGRHVIEDPTGRMFTACELWELPPPTGARVVCGGSGAALRELGPDLVHDTTKRTSSAFHFELGGRAYRALLKQSLAEQAAEDAALPAAERTGAELGRKWTATLLGGERVGFDLTLGARSVEMAVEIGFRSVEDPMFAAFLASAATAESLPHAYAALPEDSHIRGALAGLDAATGRSLRDEGVLQMITALEEEMVITPAQRVELERASTAVVPERLRGVFAVGQDLDAAKRLLAAPDKAGPASKELEQAMGGWTIVGVEADPNVYLPAMREFVKVANYRFPDKATASSGTGSGGPMLPPPSRRSASTLKLRPVPKGLPAGAMHLVDEVRPNPLYKPAPGAPPPLRPYDSHVLVLPDGPLVWIVVARKEADALARAKQVLEKSAQKSAAPPPKGAVLTGELSLAGTIAQTIEVETLSQRDEARATFRRLTELPAGGRTGIPLSLHVVAEPSGAEKGYVLRAVGQLPAAVVTDWLRFAMTAAKTAPVSGKP